MDYIDTDKIFLLQKRISEELSQKAKFDLKVRIFDNRSIAIYDVCMGLLTFFSHKPKVALLKQGSSLIDLLMPNLLRQKASVLQKSEAQTLSQFVLDFDQEVNFLVWSAENELTGSNLISFEEQIELNVQLSKKRIFSIQIISQMNKFYLEILKQSPYSIFIESKVLFTEKTDLLNLCRVFHSDKLKTTNLVGATKSISNLNFDLMSNKSQTINELTHLEDSDDQETIFKINEVVHFQDESLKISQCKNKLCILSETVSGSALKSSLEQSIVEQSYHFFAPSDLPIHILNGFKSWWNIHSDNNHKSNYIRGLLLIEFKCLTMAEHQTLINQLIQVIQKEHENIFLNSSWNISN